MNRTADALVIGGGISGIACARSMADHGLNAVVIDRGQALGGRMASRRLRSSGTAWDGHVTDIGASYFTAEDPAFSGMVQELMSAGVVREWTNAFHVAEASSISSLTTGPMRYTATGGIRAVVEHLAASLDPARVVSAHAIEELIVNDNGWLSAGQWSASGVALCMPGPQANRLMHPSNPAFGPTIQAASAVNWLPVIAVTAVFDEVTWDAFDGIFVNDDPTLSWIANDGSRRGTGAPVLVAHVTPDLAARHLDDPHQVSGPAVQVVRRLLDIPTEPVWVEVQRWTYARPSGAAQAPCFLDDVLPLGLAGDAWAGGPRVEAAWLSGTALGAALAERLIG